MTRSPAWIFSTAWATKSMICPVRATSWRSERVSSVRWRIRWNNSTIPVARARVAITQMEMRVTTYFWLGDIFITSDLEEVLIVRVSSSNWHWPKKIYASLKLKWCKKPLMDWSPIFLNDWDVDTRWAVNQNRPQRSTSRFNLSYLVGFSRDERVQPLSNNNKLDGSCYNWCFQSQGTWWRYSTMDAKTRTRLIQIKTPDQKLWKA